VHDYNLNIVILRFLSIYIFILVGGFNLSEKYESQLGALFPISGKIIQMFQTTNQTLITINQHH